MLLRVGEMTFSLKENSQKSDTNKLLLLLYYILLYQKDIDVALIMKEFHQVENIKYYKVMLASVGGVHYLYDYWFHY